MLQALEWVESIQGIDVGPVIQCSGWAAGNGRRLSVTNNADLHNASHDRYCTRRKGCVEL